MAVQNFIYDVAVIGGGPSGMMAAGRAGELGAKTVLLEKNFSLGRKLLITGKGRSNITRAEFDAKELVKKYGRGGDFLLFPLSAFGVKETLDFFEKRGMSTKTERGKRIFPKSDSSLDVLSVLEGYLEKGGVKIILNSCVKGLEKNGGKITKIILKDGTEISARNFIICTGGKSFPGTGSTGDGYKWAKDAGHTIVKISQALVPLEIKESWPKEAQGLSLKNVELSVFQGAKRKNRRFGEMLFTHFGISGPIVLDMSGEIGKLAEKGQVNLLLDLKPALDIQTLDKRLQSDFSEFSNKNFENSLDKLLPQKIIPVVVKMSQIPADKKTNQITKEERRVLASLLKKMEMTVKSLLGFDMAIVTSGGVSLKEIDAKTMKSKIIDNLYFAGEIINLHGPTGGYNLQQCWSTGYLAGQSAAK